MRRLNSVPLLGLLLMQVQFLLPQEPGQFRRADANGDGRLDLSDAVFTLNWRFLGSQGPTCLDAADSNDDGEVNISDPIHSLGFLFSGGSAPPVPFPECGTDPTDDELGCTAYRPCGPAASPADVLAAYASLLAVYAREFPASVDTDKGRTGLCGLVPVDLDRDGVPEIAGAYSGGDRIDIHAVEPGGGTVLIAQHVVGSISGLTALRLGPDRGIAVAVQAPHQLLVLRSPLLDQALRLELPAEPGAIAAADLDGDGLDDMAVSLPARRTCAVALSRREYALEEMELASEPGTLAARALPGRSQEILVFHSRSPEVTAVFFDGTRTVLLPVGEFFEPSPPGHARLEAWDADLDGDGPDDFLIRELGDLSRVHQLVAYVQEGPFWARAGTLPLGTRRHLEVTDLNDDGLEDILAQGWDFASNSVVFDASFQEAPGLFVAFQPLTLAIAIPISYGLGGISTLACIKYLGLNCGGVSGEIRIDSTDARMVAFKQVLCAILDLIDRFSQPYPCMNSNTCGALWRRITDEIRDQKNANEIHVGDLGDADKVAWTDPFFGDMIFEPAEAFGVVNDPTTKGYWNLMRLLMHEGAHAEIFAPETRATRVTENFLELVLKDLQDPNGHFQKQEGYTAQQAAAAAQHVRCQKWNEARYRHYVNGTWESLAKAKIRDACDNKSTFISERDEALTEYGGTTIDYPDMVNCTTRCYKGRVVFTHCGVTLQFMIDVCGG